MAARWEQRVAAAVRLNTGRDLGAFEFEARETCIEQHHAKPSDVRRQYASSTRAHRKFDRHVFRWTIPLLFAFGFPLAIGGCGHLLYNVDSGCLPNGKLRLTSDPQSAWSLDGLFAITTPFGSFSFTQAKLIDEAWDIVIGRFCQIVVVVILSRIYMRAVLFSMESSLVTCETFAITAFNVGSAQSPWTYMKSFRHASTRSTSASINTGLMVLASIYPLLFSTLVSTMTGYQPTTIPHVLDRDGNTFPQASMQQLQYIVWDPERIGFPFGLNVTAEMLDNGWHSLSNYYRANSLRGNNSIYINDQFFDIPDPHLNVTSMPPYRWSFLNETYDLAWLEDNGSCVPTKTYQWGFSFLLLFVFAVATLIFVFCVYLLSLRTALYSYSAAESKHIGRYKATLTLAKAIRDTLGGDADDLTEDEIAARLKRRNGGLQVDVAVMPVWQRAMVNVRLEEMGVSHDGQRLSSTHKISWSDMTWKDDDQKRKDAAVCEGLDATEDRVSRTRDLRASSMSDSRREEATDT